ncbi:hypothetical protein CIHG_10059 [Coccidioides immitis H538.4]|uniref:Uncharacterized protein n=2 Tax=Coccidioides immitis TaxID=5501 RepID=A0A0J8UWF9_COCIT|nr:hypothetical protein CIRG_09417 [Coccidioides immitis RMSCC 2394]KMU92253.1 hypothetical protein CIHG_10059 [Coccidioides immitis H538.4]
MDVFTNSSDTHFTTKSGTCFVTTNGRYDRAMQQSAQRLRVWPLIMWLLSPSNLSFLYPSGREHIPRQMVELGGAGLTVGATTSGGNTSPAIGRDYYLDGA